MNNTNSISQRRWLYVTAAGVALLTLTAVWSTVRLQAARTDMRESRARYHFHRNDPAQREMRMLHYRADRQGSLDDRDWQRLMEYYKGSDKDLRSNVISAMMGLGKSPRRGQILTIVRPLLKSNNVLDEAQALTLLWRFDDPAWPREMALRRDRTEPIIRISVEAATRPKRRARS